MSGKNVLQSAKDAGSLGIYVHDLMIKSVMNYLIGLPKYKRNLRSLMARRLRSKPPEVTT